MDWKSAHGLFLHQNQNSIEIKLCYDCKYLNLSSFIAHTNHSKACGARGSLPLNSDGEFHLQYKYEIRITKYFESSKALVQWREKFSSNILLYGSHKANWTDSNTKFAMFLVHEQVLWIIVTMFRIFSYPIFSFYSYLHFKCNLHSRGDIFDEKIK